MKTTEKQILKGDLIDTLDAEFFDDEIDNICKKLNTLKTDYENNGWSNIKIITSYNYTDVQFDLKGDRLETDGEVKRRLIESQKILEKEEAYKEKIRQEAIKLGLIK